MKLKIPVAACAFAATVAAGLAACGESSPATSSSSGTNVGTAGVNLGTPAEQISATEQLVFSPATLNAHVGDVIQWTATGTMMHTVTFDGFDSLSDVALNSGGIWEVKFTTPGTYNYHCTLHPGMNGTVVVS
jgi:plastocyanin